MISRNLFPALLAAFAVCIAAGSCTKKGNQAAAVPQQQTAQVPAQDSTAKDTIARQTNTTARQTGTAAVQPAAADAGGLSGRYTRQEFTNSIMSLTQDQTLEKLGQPCTAGNYCNSEVWQYGASAAAGCTSQWDIYDPASGKICKLLAVTFNSGGTVENVEYMVF
jgi:hypothetical protein